MTVVKKIKKASSFDLTNYVNTETGETLLENLPKELTVSCSEKTGLVAIHSTDYAVIETTAMMALLKVINNSDLANVLKMSVITKTPMNIVFNENIPHTNETLQKYLEIKSESMFMKLIKRLIKEGILYQIKGKIYGEVRVCYMLNPFLSRKRKTFDEKVFEVFDKFELNS